MYSAYLTHSFAIAIISEVLCTRIFLLIVDEVGAKTCTEQRKPLVGGRSHECLNVNRNAVKPPGIDILIVEAYHMSTT